MWANDGGGGGGLFTKFKENISIFKEVFSLFEYAVSFLCAVKMQKWSELKFTIMQEALRFLQYTK